jgi:hypothetical protein
VAGKGEGVLELCPKGGSIQYPPGGGGGHIGGYPTVGDPPHGIIGGGPIWEPYNMKVWLVNEYEFEFWIENKENYTCDPSKRGVEGSPGALGHKPYGERHVDYTNSVNHLLSNWIRQI